MSSLNLQSHHFSSQRLSCSIRRLSKRNHELSHSTVFLSKGAFLNPSLDEILSQGKDHQVRIQNQSSSAARGWTDISPDILTDLQEGKAVAMKTSSPQSAAPNTRADLHNRRELIQQRQFLVVAVDPVTSVRLYLSLASRKWFGLALESRAEIEHHKRHSKPLPRVCAESPPSIHHIQPVVIDAPRFTPSPQPIPSLVGGMPVKPRSHSPALPSTAGEGGGEFREVEGVGGWKKMELEWSGRFAARKKKREDERKILENGHERNGVSDEVWKCGSEGCWTHSESIRLFPSSKSMLATLNIWE
ncbi:hypothetical protein BLNAU_5425 [Blattamonas nauphoetae]|uniref:Uncharacterized protein n=1 Tax=Blattamonas nauphoetae TaxID=2049346 RepID=A0ABQ9Y7E7_9EUKA|nr:hypothetical protein BLNAU_5425 [Blattamonas nauphoetae]